MIFEQDLDPKNALKFRLTGASFWLFLLIIIVPIWYANPVEFNPNGVSEQVDEKKIVSRSFKLSELKSTVHKKVLKLPSKPEVSKVEINKVFISKKQEDKKTKKINSVTWIVKIAAYKSKEKAEELHDTLRYSYQSSIKFFSKSKYYSVRIGPYEDKEVALKDQKYLNKLLHIKTTLVQIKNKSK